MFYMWSNNNFVFFLFYFKLFSFYIPAIDVQKKYSNKSVSIEFGTECSSFWRRYLHSPYKVSTIQIQEQLLLSVSSVTYQEMENLVPLMFKKMVPISRRKLMLMEHAVVAIATLIQMVKSVVSHIPLAKMGTLPNNTVFFSWNSSTISPADCSLLLWWKTLFVCTSALSVISCFFCNWIRFFRCFKFFVFANCVQVKWIIHVFFSKKKKSIGKLKLIWNRNAVGMFIECESSNAKIQQ